MRQDALVFQEVPSHPNFRDLTGKTFGKLVVLGFAGYRGNSRAQYHCECECGNITTVEASNLRRGQTTSCGCWRVDAQNLSHTKHGLYHHPLYNRWFTIMNRCHNPNDIGYHNYGGRGIHLHPPWHDRDLFIKEVEAEIGMPPFEEVEIDRIDNSQGYEPGNLRWVTRKDNMRNTRCYHGHSALRDGTKQSSTKNSYQAMKQYNKGDICDEWNAKDGFKIFLQDMGEKPLDKKYLKRIDKNLPYSKDNCTWSNKRGPRK